MNDLIERSKAVEAIYWKVMEMSNKEMAESVLSDVPTVDAEPVRHGHWIFNPKDAIEMMFTLPRCSNCGAESPDCGNYCSHCGAKMDEVEDG